MPRTTCQSAAQPQPPAEQPLAENVPTTCKNQGWKKKTEDITAEALLVIDVAQSALHPTPQPAAQNKRERKAVITASNYRDNRPNKRAKMTDTDTTAAPAKACQSAAACKPTKAQTQATAKEAEQQASQARLEDAKRNLAQMQVDKDQKINHLIEESIRSYSSKWGKWSTEKMEDSEAVDGNMANDDDKRAPVKLVVDGTVNQNVVSVCLSTTKGID